MSLFDSCCSVFELKKARFGKGIKKKRIRVALAGNANVGKSVLFNYLTGLNQHVANWPGKTVEIAEGTFCYQDYEIEIVDLPGIYSLSAFSKEEELSKEYIVEKKPDIVINVINSCALERNLFFTLQLLKLNTPVVVALNQTDAAKKKGITIDEGRLSKALGVPAVKITATKGVGVGRLLKASILESRKKPGRSVSGKKGTKQLYETVSKISRVVQKTSKPLIGLGDWIDDITTDRVFGYLIMLLVLGLIFYVIFSFGSILSIIIGNLFNGFRPAAEDLDKNIVWEGIVGGFVAGLTLVLPYVLPFYLLLTILEDSGYITRIAYLLDGFAHRIGFHGKAFIPMILGYGCNVPACFSCRIMEYERDRLITAFAITLVPCTARTVVILALVGTFLGPWWAISLYVFNIIVVAIMAKLAFKILPGEPMGLIMEMSPYRMPSVSNVLKHSWWKIKSILSVVFPYYIVGGLVFALIYLTGIFGFIDNAAEPITVGWLGLPLFATTLLIFGLVRKEFIVVLPAVVFGTTDLSAIFTPIQMVTLTVVAMFYTPCLATIEALKREFGLKKAVSISILNLVLAIFLGGVAFRVIQNLI